MLYLARNSELAARDSIDACGRGGGGGRAGARARARRQAHPNKPRKSPAPPSPKHHHTRSLTQTHTLTHSAAALRPSLDAVYQASGDKRRLRANLTTEEGGLQRPTMLKFNVGGP